MSSPVTTSRRNYSYKDDWNKIYSSHYEGLYVLPWLGASINEDQVQFVNDIPKNSKIIDIACGDGVFCEYLASKGFKNILGIDVSDEIIIRNKKQSQSPNVNYKVLDVFDLTNDVLYDVVFCNLLLHHIQPEDVNRFLLKINSIINPHGGILYFSFLKTPKTAALYIARDSYFTREHNVIMYNPDYVKRTLQNIGTGKLIKEGEYVMSNQFYSDEYQVLIYKK